MRDQPCPCRHEDFRAPRTHREALALARHQRAVESLLAVVVRDPARHRSVLRCTRCGRYWAEDSMVSGHAELFYRYPITTADPHTWLASTRPLDLEPE